VLKTLKPIEIPARYCTWSGIAMNLSVVVRYCAAGVSVFRVVVEFNQPPRASAEVEPV